MQNKSMISLFHAALDLYVTTCKPICEKLNMAQPAFDILLFLANNPEYHTAKDITRFRGIKPNLVSFYVKKMVRDGFLKRESVPGDRRKVKLLLTPKSEPIIAEGHMAQEAFFSTLKEGMTEEDIQHFERCISLLEKNITSTKEKNRKNGVTEQ